MSGAHMMGVADRKASIERLCLSPYVEKPFNSKVIKSFVPELNRVLGFLCSMYICYEHSMYVSHIRIMGMVHMLCCSVFINEMFNFCIDNVVGKPIINKGLFYIVKFIKEDSSRGK